MTKINTNPYWQQYFDKKESPQQRILIVGASLGPLGHYVLYFL